MVRAKEAPSGCIVYLMLSIVINLFILILRISAHEVQNNATVAVAAAAVATPTTVPATIYHTDVTTTTTNAAVAATATIANDIKTKSDDIHESGKWNYIFERFCGLDADLWCLMFWCIVLNMQTIHLSAKLRSFAALLFLRCLMNPVCPHFD